LWAAYPFFDTFRLRGIQIVFKYVHCRLIAIYQAKTQQLKRPLRGAVFTTPHASDRGLRPKES
jgi:hypothetical protein